MDCLEFPRNMNRYSNIHSRLRQWANLAEEQGSITEVFPSDLLFITTSFVQTFSISFFFFTHPTFFAHFLFYRLFFPAKTPLISSSSNKCKWHQWYSTGSHRRSLRRCESETGSGANLEGVLGKSPALPLCLYLHYHIHQGCFKPWFLSSVISPTTFLPVLESDLCFPPLLPRRPLLFFITLILIFLLLCIIMTTVVVLFIFTEAGRDRRNHHILTFQLQIWLAMALGQWLDFNWLVTM